MTAITRTAPRRQNDWARRAGIVQDALLITVSALFAYVHVQRILDGHVSSAFFAIEQGMLVWMFLTRRRTNTTSTRPMDWVVAAIGGWLPLAVRPSDAAGTLLESIGTGVQLGGLLLVIVGFSYLGRSFGVVAANRGVKVNGPYRLVRHPIYFAHFVTVSGFVLANPGALNLGILLVATTFQMLRIRAEERVLSQSGDYQSYQEVVRWRLLPGVF